MDSSALNFGSNCWPRDILAEWRTRLGPLRQGRVALVRPAGPSGLPPASEPLPSGRGSDRPCLRWGEAFWPPLCVIPTALVCHSRESGNPVVSFWTAAYAGMTPAGFLLVQE